MARTSYPKAAEPLPAPLPPETRTVGQLVAESIRLYGQRFWAALALGILPAALTLLAAQLPRTARLIVTPTVGAAVLSVSFVGASCIVLGRRPPLRVLAVPFGAGLVAFAPVPFLVFLFVLPALAWLAFVGLAVPAAIAERLGLRAALVRGTKLARVDFVHALGSLATLAIVAFLTQSVLFFLLRGTGKATLWTASFLADLVIAPLVFLGFALLYVDQAARSAAGPSV